jgi:transposase
MLSFSGALRVFVAIDPCDMRIGLIGPNALNTERLAEDPRGGSLFVFKNRRRNQIKILFRDRTGAWICTKRLEGIRATPWFLLWC